MLRRILLKILMKYFSPPTLREEILERVMRLVSLYGLESGDYLEFGVDQGKSFASAYHMAQKYGLRAMRFYAFDSFQGLPAIRGVDAEVPQFRPGQYACTEEEFKKNIKKRGVDLEKVVIVPGWYHETLNPETKKKLKIKNAAVIWVDCDLYESTVPVLDFITDYAADGTVIVFDDWFCFRGSPQRGEQRAFREWLAQNPGITASEYYKHGFFGNSFILHKN